MRFLRHLAAVALVVAVIVGLGLLWAHASGGGGGFRQPPPAALPRLGPVKDGVIRAGPGIDYHPRGFRLTGFQLADAANLIRTGVIESLLAAVVITVSVLRRRRRRMRRAAASGA